MGFLPRAFATLAAPVVLGAFAPLSAQIITGTFQYEDQPYDQNGYAGSLTNKPIRFADVDVIDVWSNQVIGRGSTDSLGGYRIQLTGPIGPGGFFARCSASTRYATVQGGYDPRPHYEVRQPAPGGGGPLYSIQSGVQFFPQVSTGTTTATALTLFTPGFGSTTGSPFNILDVGIVMSDYINNSTQLWAPGGVGSTGAPSPTFLIEYPAQLDLAWDITGATAGGSFRATVSFHSGYDDAVIGHEIGHLMHFRYGTALGGFGAHTLAESSLDPRQAWLEAVATFLGSRALNLAGYALDSAYLDTFPGPTATTPIVGLRYDPENKNAFQVPWGFPANFDPAIAGECDETAILSSLWDLADGASGYVDDDPFDFTLFNPGGVGLSQPMDGAVVRGILGMGSPQLFSLATTPIPQANVEQFWSFYCNNPVFQNADFTGVGLKVFSDHGIHLRPDQYEPNDTFTGPRVLGVDGLWRTSTLYSNAFTPGSGPVPFVRVGPGDVDVYEFHLNQPADVTIETRYPRGASDEETMADTNLELFDDALVPLASNDNPPSGADRNAVLGPVSLLPGVHYVRVTASSLTATVRPIGTYEIRLSKSGANQAPEFLSPPPGPTIHPIFNGVPPGAVSVQGRDPEDGDQLEYLWSTPDGGSLTNDPVTVLVAGSGPSNGYAPGGTSPIPPAPPGMTGGPPLNGALYVSRPGPVATFVPPSNVSLVSTYRLRVIAQDSDGAQSAPMDFLHRVYPDGVVHPGSLVVGQTGSIEVHTRPNTTVWLAYSASPLTPGIPSSVGPGTFYLNPGDYVVADPVYSGSSGIAVIPAPVPNDPNLAGIQLHYQAVYQHAFDPTLFMSEVASATIQGAP